MPITYQTAYQIFKKLDTLKESTVLTKLGREFNSLDFINRLMSKSHILRCSNPGGWGRDQKCVCWGEGAGIKVLQASLVDIFEIDTSLHHFLVPEFLFPHEENHTEISNII